VVGEPHDGLPDGDDLSGLDRRRRYDAVNVGFELRVGDLIAGEVERALRAFEAPLRLVLGGFLAFVIRDGRVAPCPEGVVARLVRRGLREV